MTEILEVIRVTVPRILRLLIKVLDYLECNLEINKLPFQLQALWIQISQKKFAFFLAFISVIRIPCHNLQRIGHNSGFWGVDYFYDLEDRLLLQRAIKIAI